MFWSNLSPPPSGSKSKPSKKPTKAGGKMSNAGDIFLQNVRLSPN
jgi:hypothetical protein